MFIEFKDDNGEWCYFDENHTTEKDPAICLRPLSADELTKIDKLTVTHKQKIKNGVVYDEKTENTELSNKMVWDFCIVDWRQIKLNGNVLEPTPENKVLLMKNMDCRRFCNDQIDRISSKNKSIEELRLKNLENSSTGE